MSDTHRSLEPWSRPSTEAAEEAVAADSFRTGSRNHRDNRKARQLCRQVAETLDLVLSGDSCDELIQSLSVVSVEPAPNASRLLVIVSADLPAEQFDGQEIMQRLTAQAGRLRSEVAATIHRKKVPLLTFHLLGPVAIGRG